MKTLTETLQDIATNATTTRDRAVVRARAAKATLDDYRAPKAARTKARREIDRLLSWWCRLSPEQAMAAE